MIVGKKALGHRHGIERNAGLLHKILESFVIARIGSTLSKKEYRTFCRCKDIGGTLYRIRRRTYRRSRIHGGEIERFDLLL